MRAIPRAARRYLFGLWAVMAVGIVWTIWQWGGAVPNPLLLIAALVGFACADYFSVEFEISDNERVSMTVVDSALVFLLPITGAYGSLIVSLGSFGSDLIQRHPWYKALFNAAQRSVTYLVMLAAYRALVVADAGAYAGWRGLLALLLIAAINATLNPLLVSTIVALASGQPLLQVYRDSISQVHWVYLLTLPLGALLAVAWEHTPWLLAVGVVPLVIAHRSFTTMAALQAESRRSRTLAEKLERLQDTTTAMLASPEPLPLLKTVSTRLAALLGARAGWAVLLDGQPRIVSPGGAPARWLPEAYADELRHHEIRQLDPAAAARLHGDAELEGATLVLIPMLIEGRLLGGFALVSDEPAPLVDDDRRVLLAFAAQAGRAVERVQLFEQLRTKQEELIHSSKLAALGTFASGIAHEFNNLLAVVVGFAELGLTSQSVAEKDEALDVAMRSCLRGQSITSGLLTFARQRGGRREPAQIREVVVDTITLVQREFAKVGVTISHRLRTGGLTVCDPGQIAQVVMNLLTNARDAMGERKGGTIAVTLDEREGQIELRVTDTGSGIPASLLPHIFQPFTTTKGGRGGSTASGTGLGLAISYGIVEGHGGAIHVESVVGEGTTMIVRLPVVAPELEQAHQPQALARPEGSRLLIVEDDPVLGESLRRHLAQHGFQTTLAARAEEALAQYRARPFDLVLSDVLMPGLSAAEMLQELRALDPQVRVLAMSGNAGLDDAQQMLELGGLGVVSKPFKIEDLLQAIHANLAVPALAAPE